MTLPHSGFRSRRLSHCEKIIKTKVQKRTRFENTLRLEFGLIGIDFGGTKMDEPHMWLKASMILDSSWALWLHGKICHIPQHVVSIAVFFRSLSPHYTQLPSFKRCFPHLKRSAYISTIFQNITFGVLEILATIQMVFRAWRPLNFNCKCSVEFLHTRRKQHWNSRPP